MTAPAYNVVPPETIEELRAQVREARAHMDAANNAAQGYLLERDELRADLRVALDTLRVIADSTHDLSTEALASSALRHFGDAGGAPSAALPFEILPAHALARM